VTKPDHVQSFPPSENDTKVTVRAIKGRGLVASIPAAVVTAAIASALTYYSQTRAAPSSSGDEALRVAREALATAQAIQQTQAQALAEQRQLNRWLESNVSVLLVRTDGWRPAPNK
jgi:hypothetical protein